VAIVLPVVATFFFVFGFLEDSGYIPRLAIFSDRIFRTMGLNGKAVLPMVLGLGCDTMATMTTRMPGDAERTADRRPAACPGDSLLGSARDEFSAFSAECPSRPDDAVWRRHGPDVLRRVSSRRGQFGRAIGVHHGIAAAEAAALRNIVRKTVLRVRWYLGEAVPLFLVGTALLFRIEPPGLLAKLTAAAEPWWRAVGAFRGTRPRCSSWIPPARLRRAGLFQMSKAGQLDGVRR